MSRLRLLLLYLRQQSRPFPPTRLGCSRLPTMLCFWFTAPAVCSLANEFDEVSRHVVIEIIKRIRKKIIGRRRVQGGALYSECTELFESDRSSAFRLKVPKSDGT